MACRVGSGVEGSKLTYEDYVSLPDDGRRYEILDGDLVVTPSPLIRHQRAIEGPPDLVVEILSSTTESRDRGSKKKLYARFGVDHYWLVDTVERTIELYARTGNRYKLAGKNCGSTVMTCVCPAGLEISLGEVWAD